MHKSCSLKQENTATIMKMVLTVMRLIASLLADGINAERSAPANCKTRIMYFNEKHYKIMSQWT